MMAVLEVVNPLLGLVKTGFFPAMIQVTVPDFLTLQVLHNTELTTYYIVPVSLDEANCLDLMLPSDSPHHMKNKQKLSSVIIYVLYLSIGGS